MSNLPGNCITRPCIAGKYYVLSIKRMALFYIECFLHNTYYLIPNTASQKGFAVIPLVILMLFGIAAGTLLVQNGANFLPKAAIVECDPYYKALCSKRGLDCHKLNTPTVPYVCIDRNGQYCDSNDKTTYHNAKLGTGFKCKSNEFCGFNKKESFYECQPDPDGTRVGVCNNDTDCYKRYGIRVGGTSITEHFCTQDNWAINSLPYCDPSKDSANAFGCNIDKASYCGTGESSCFIEDGEAKCKTAPAEAPAAQSASGTTAGGCTQAEINACKQKNSKTDRCYKSSNGSPICLYSASLERQEACEKACPNGNNQGCVILRGEQRCIYPDSATSCDSGDGGSSCKLITRDGVKISTDAQKCNEGWKNFCRLLFNKGCVDKPDGVPDCEGTATPLSQPAPAVAPATVPQSQTGAGAPAAGTAQSNQSTSTKTGSFDNKVAVAECPEQKHRDYCAANASIHGVSSGKCYQISGQARCKYDKDFPKCNDSDTRVCSDRGGCVLEKITVGNEQIQFSRCADSPSAAGGQQATTGCETLKDAEGLTIPCYKIGVFTPEELKATEAQAKVALQRYDQYKRILSEVGGEIDSAIKAKAEEKIREAERLANACLAK